MLKDERYAIVVVAHTLIRGPGDSILLLERANTGYMDGFLVPPGGHVERGEFPSEAAMREVAEESNLALLEHHLALVMPFAGGIDFLFESRNWSGEPSIGEPSKFSRIGWFRTSSLPRNVAPFLPKALELIDSDISYHEYRE